MNSDLRKISINLTEFIQQNEKEMSEELKRFVLMAKDQLARAALIKWEKSNIIQLPRIIHKNS